ncbi:hypothetical protein O0I10_010090 [Lichtheimia ornata]|uniref:Proteasome assembly chaperone 2 n=1 Tax=Lichtheimia ornata TaxID=688661 RepID=A0AAD7UW90_9FUNG|nr:uncharacterized protein O0I10_010090 [Lichtheimia ornata]KAJ8654268.1 hypothetical protein O0I10_010090 [Lichtheimia ornata]
MDTFVPASSFNTEQLAGSTLVLPSVSIGNVPQLTCDLFVHTLGLERVGFINNDAVMSVAGKREGVQGPGVAVAVEVYQSSDRRWTMIQQRAPTYKGKRRGYIKDLVAFVQKYKFDHVMVLTSADASLRTDAQITSVPFRVVGTEDAILQKAQDIGIPRLDTDEKDVHGTGMGVPFFSALKEAHINTTMMIMFALEGDNVNDAVLFTNMFNTLFQLRADQGSWTPPPSWDFLFGTPFNQELYQ